MALPALILGTGPSLGDQVGMIRKAHAAERCWLYAMNDSYRHFDLERGNSTWLACDPKWHARRGPIAIPNCEQWHWDREISDRGGYRYISGLRNPDGSVLDGVGLSLDPDSITLGHSSAWQCLNIALHDFVAGKHTGPILLCGYDMTYRDNEPRHYFKDLSDVPGEYEQELRKFSLFDKPDRTGLLYEYKHIADQQERGELPCMVLNATPRSAMKWFPFTELHEWI